MAECFERVFATQGVAAALACYPGLDDAFARVHLVMHSNDAVARATTLRVLAAMAPLLRTRLTVHHTVLKSLVVAALALHAAHAVGDDALPRCEQAEELVAGLHAAARLASCSAVFARALLPVVRTLLCGSSAVAPVVGAAARGACVATLAGVGRDAHLVAAAHSLCFDLATSSTEAASVRCAALSTAAELATRVLLGLDRVLERVCALVASLADVAASAAAAAGCGSADDEAVLRCALVCAGRLVRAQLVPREQDAELFATVAADPRWTTPTRAAAALAALAATPPPDAAAARVLRSCASDSSDPVLALCVLERLGSVVLADATPSSALAEAVRAAVACAVANTDSARVTALLPACARVVCSPAYTAEQRAAVLDDVSAAHLAPAACPEHQAAAVAFWALAAKHGRRLSGAAVQPTSTQADQLLAAAQRAGAALPWSVAAGAGAVLAASGDEARTEAVAEHLVAHRRYWDAYAVLRVAFCRGLYGVCARLYPRLDVSLRAPYRPWLAVLAMVSRAEALLHKHQQQQQQQQQQQHHEDAEEEEEEEEEERQEAAVLLVRAATVLEGAVEPAVACALQVRVLRLRAAVCGGGHRSAEARRALADKYRRLAAGSSLTAHSRRVLEGAADAVEDGNLAAVTEWYPPAFFVLQTN